MHVRHPAVQRIFYGNNCSLCLPFLHGINGILEGKARKRYAIGRISERGQMGIGTRSALISDGTRGFRGGLCRHFFDKARSEEHTSELPVTNAHLVCRLLLEKKK